MTGDNRALSGQWLGNYLLQSLLKRGGMAEVYRAQEIDTHREVAVKVLPLALAADPDYVASFRNEIVQVRKLDHPNIVPIEAFGEQGPYFYLVMPLFRASLHDVLLLHGRIAPLDAVQATAQIASALTAVHALGLIHRDIKPGNILLSDDRALLTDFGIVRQIAFGDQGQAPTLAGTGLPVGTPQYMAPEQLSGQYVDYRADLYALGAVLYQMLTGQPPHVADSAYAIAARVLNEPITPPSALNPAIGPELDAIVMRALARDPQDRFADAGSMRDALRKVEDQLRRDTASGRVAPSVDTNIYTSVVPSVGFGTSGALGGAVSGPRRNTGYGSGDGGNGGGGGATPPLVGAGDDHRRRRTPQLALLAILAVVLLAISAFCGIGLIINNGANGARGGNASANTPATPTLPSDATYNAMAATATNYALTPTVTTGPGTPTPTPRPPLPTRTPTPRPPTVTTGPGTPTPTPYPTDTPVPTDTATDVPTDTPTDVPTDTPTDVPTATPTDEPTDTPTEDTSMDTPTDTPTDTLSVPAPFYLG